MLKIESSQRKSMLAAAIQSGFTQAVWLDGLKLECEARLRQYCNSEGCPNHGKNWVCPPGCGTLEECAERVSPFDQGILLQSASDIDAQAADYTGLNRKHNLRLREFIVEACIGMEILALTSGGCVFCETCAFPEPCIKPLVRMNSLSAYGIDVGKLCQRANWEYSFRPDRLTYIAIVLVRNALYPPRSMLY